MKRHLVNLGITLKNHLLVGRVWFIIDFLFIIPVFHVVIGSLDVNIVLVYVL